MHDAFTGNGWSKCALTGSAATHLDLWFEVMQWLNHEADLLDSGRMDEWLALLTDDIDYRMPIRITRERGSQSDSDSGNPLFLEDHDTLRLRVERLKTDFAWAEDPRSRTRRFVTNVRVDEADKGVLVRSYILLYRSRGEYTEIELLSAERADLLTRTEEGLRLRSREIKIDQATLGVRNLALML